MSNDRSSPRQPGDLSDAEVERIVQAVVQAVQRQRSATCRIGGSDIDLSLNAALELMLLKEVQRHRLHQCLNDGDVVPSTSWRRSPDA